MARTLAIAVDRGRCMGNGQCVSLAPEVFEHDENLQSTVVNPAGAPEDVILQAAVFCPTGAISVADAETGKELFPG